MRYDGGHKQETHEKLVKIAARMLREKGPDGFAVAELMQEAGLTHGGFYAHFESKEACVAEALREIFAQLSQRVERAIEGLPPRHALATIIDIYVSQRHRDNPADGCPVTSLNSDMPRQPPAIRDTFDKGVKSMVATMKKRLAAAHIDDAESLAPAVLSAVVGAVALSRAVNDKTLSDELLVAARNGIKARLGLSDATLEAYA
ncbi:MAG TPA: TetR/AcrR family transcriptional regulator [Rhizomicrobium sp.]|nr:TetR/AcrR family transcriptional regulator [Rhizomicrobium sp.]